MSPDNVPELYVPALIHFRRSGTGIRSVDLQLSGPRISYRPTALKHAHRCIWLEWVVAQTCSCIYAEGHYMLP